MSILELILILENKSNGGIEITKRKGILTSTWEIYKKERFFYFFDINEKIIFDDDHKYTREELIKEFENSHFKIDYEFD
jgi:hypothetical protein